jgi:hypothetical protein
MTKPLWTACLLALLHVPAHAQSSFAALARRVNQLTAAADSARTPARRAELSLLRLQTLQRALDAHAAERPGAGYDARPLRDGRIRADTSEIVYGEPQGQWFVRADRLWALNTRFRALPVAERIAWAAATQDLPGECEGDVTCMVGSAEATMGRYLALYPTGAHAAAALREMRPTLEYVESETRPRATHAQFCRADGRDGTVTPARLRTLRATVQRSAGAERDAAARVLWTLLSRCR